MRLLSFSVYCLSTTKRIISPFSRIIWSLARITSPFFEILEQIKLKMEISKKAAELKEKIFSQLEAKLATYQSSPAYEALLDSQIDRALKFAGNDEVKIYIDPNDEALAHKLSVKHGIDIIISKYPFHGGLRAVIPAKNILIDNSFEKKIAEAKDKFDVEMEVL